MFYKVAEEMSIKEKLGILTDAAKYDVACTSSGVDRRGDGTGIGNTEKGGICHSFSADGRCISLLKILFTNECIYDCKYCINRKSNDVPRASFTPDEVCELTMGFYKRNYIEGLFLSSGILYNPDFTMELIYQTIYKLRTLETLEEIVKIVYKVLRKTEKYMAIRYDYIEEILPHDIFFITTGELEEMYPDKTPKEREYLISKDKGAVCVMQIGDLLKSGEKHDGRAPDYDDWALNADIIVYYPVLDIALELSSMGIRVDKDALLSQLEKAGCPERAGLPFQKAIINEELPYTIGGGIGQSRICMFFLRKAHIGEVQCSLWPENVMEETKKAGVPLL